jgi:hypothetical protein
LLCSLAAEGEDGVRHRGKHPTESVVLPNQRLEPSQKNSLSLPWPNPVKRILQQLPDGHGAIGAELVRKLGGEDKACLCSPLSPVHR